MAGQGSRNPKESAGESTSPPNAVDLASDGRQDATISASDFGQGNPSAPVTPQGPEDGLVGRVVAGRYRVLEKLGEGGMGVVYLAEHVTIEKRVALKVLLHEYARKPDLKDRFLQEAKAAARIGHENIVDITDFGDTPDASVFFAMEYLEGRDLSRAIKGEGPFPWNRAKPILLQICRALGAAHAKGIIHRDMKPENIHLIEREGRADFVKVLDFGIAKMSVEDTGKRLTRTGMIFGTPEYMSPEQAQGNQPDHRVDIYAIGVIMYEMLTGAVPFKADTFMGILTKHIFEQPAPPSQVSPDVQIPAEVEEIVLRAMAKDREDRFQSMTEMAAALVQASGRLTRPTGDNTAVEPRRFGTSAGEPARPAVTSARGTIEPSSGEALDLDAPLPRRRVGPRLILVGLATAAIIGGVVVAATLARNGDDEAAAEDRTAATAADASAPRAAKPIAPRTLKPDATPRPERVRVKIDSRPSGAQIFLGRPAAGKKPAGETPTTLELPRHEGKTRALTIRLEGYDAARRFVSTDKDSELTVVLERSASERRRRTRRVRRRNASRTRRSSTPSPPAKQGTKQQGGSGGRVDDLLDPFGD
jgi:serine/threonine-protein kinase